jgi:hypothetical protein
LVINDESPVGFYIFFYRKNKSSECSCEYIKLELSHLAFIGAADQEDYIDIDGGKDHIVVMRRTDSRYSGSMGITSLDFQKSKCGNMSKSGTF